MKRLFVILVLGMSLSPAALAFDLGQKNSISNSGGLHCDAQQKLKTIVNGPTGQGEGKNEQGTLKATGI